MRIDKIILPLLLASAVSACTGNYENINRNPYETDKEELSRNGYLTNSKVLAMQSAVVSTDINRAHQTDILLGGAMGRYTSDSKAASWPQKFATFDAPDGWSRVMFAEIIPYLYPSYNELKSITDDQVVLAVADVIKVIGMNRVTDTYGPIPYSKMGQDGSTQVAYDSQRDVYMKMFDELDAAIAVLTPNLYNPLNADADKVFDGDVAKWVRLANSMKLRLAMRIVYAEPALAQQKAEEAVAHEVGVMASNADNAALKVFGTEGNPLSVAVKYNAGDNRSAADLTTYMNAYADPRMDSYFEPNTFAGYTPPVASAQRFVGFRCGVNLGGESQFLGYSILKIGRDTPLQWMNVAEVTFLRAEGAIRGWNMGGTAQELYEKAVAFSFEQWGASGAAAYLANETGKPDAGYVDPQGTFSYTNPLSDVTVKWEEEAGFERKLERIMIQKWIANMWLGHEAWADRRRTGYPRVIPVAVNNGGGLVPDGTTPRRQRYPASEAVTNGANYTAALGLLGGPDNIATRLWWDCKP